MSSPMSIVDNKGPLEQDAADAAARGSRMGAGPRLGEPRSSWLVKRKIGAPGWQKGLHASLHSVERLKLEAKLEGHSSCVNCLDWNSNGDLLASGSDDCNVIIWDPFKRVKKRLVNTKHDGNIFSVKFIPNSCDQIIATCASDARVKLINTITSKTLLDCILCHSNRVKRLATHPQEPNLVWSAGEDGRILQYDLRQPHDCRLSKPKNLLIDLNSFREHKLMSAKCMATNPMRKEILAVGSDDIIIRLFDRRMLQTNSDNNNISRRPQPTLTTFAPGYWRHSSGRDVLTKRSFGATYLAFSSDGSELLANMHADQIYLYNVYEPWEQCRIFPGLLKSCMGSLDKFPCKDKFFDTTGYHALQKNLGQSVNSLWGKLNGKSHMRTELSQDEIGLYREVMHKLERDSSPLEKIDHNYFKRMNILLEKSMYCAELYHLRASALLRRNWYGDNYQSIRDSVCALYLNPSDTLSFINLAYAFGRLGERQLFDRLCLIIDSNSQYFLTNPWHVRLVRDMRSLVKTNLKQPFTMWTNELWSEPIEGQRLWQIRPRQFHMFLDEKTKFLYPDLARRLLNRQDHQWLEETLRDVESLSGDPNFLCHTSGEDNPRMTAPRLAANDYTKRFYGHCNVTTDIKEANFFGRDEEYIVAGSDDGAFYIWDKRTTNLVKAVHGDTQILNCLQPHPKVCLLATSGIEPSVKLWSPIGKRSLDVEAPELRCAQNQRYVTADPLEAMMAMVLHSRPASEQAAF